jgi:archaellum component FlaC
MGAVGDALQALQSVVLMQANIERLQGDFSRLSDDLRGLKEFTHAIDKRLMRIETMVEMTRSGGGSPPRIEG